jgi:nitrate reductase NapAB chaperone NapD
MAYAEVDLFDLVFDVADSEELGYCWAGARTRFLVAHHAELRDWGLIVVMLSAATVPEAVEHDVNLARVIEANAVYKGVLNLLGEPDKVLCAGLVLTNFECLNLCHQLVAHAGAVRHAMLLESIKSCDGVVAVVLVEVEAHAVADFGHYKHADSFKVGKRELRALVNFEGNGIDEFPRERTVQ